MVRATHRRFKERVEWKGMDSWNIIRKRTNLFEHEKGLHTCPETAVTLNNESVLKEDKNTAS